jgi:hypothetical protein
MSWTDGLTRYIDRIYALSHVLTLLNPRELEETTLPTYASVIMEQVADLRKTVETIDNGFVPRPKEEVRVLAKNGAC